MVRLEQFNMRMLNRFKWFRRLNGGTWYNIRRGTLGATVWIRHRPSEADAVLKKEVYGG